MTPPGTRGPIVARSMINIHEPLSCVVMKLAEIVGLGYLERKTFVVCSH